MKIPNGPGTPDRRARIDVMIEVYRRAKQRRLVRLAMKMWRQTAADQQLAKLDARPERIH